MNPSIRIATNTSTPPRRARGLMSGILLLCLVQAATAQEWVEFVDESCRLEADLSVLNDIPCDPAACEQAIRDACDPFSCGVTCELECICENMGCPGCDPACTCGILSGAFAVCCACEKDMAFADLNNDFRDDVVIARKQPYYVRAGASNLLFMNENEVFVDRTDLAPDFSNVTADRDVLIADINGDDFPEVITAPTLGEPPRVYVNQGCDAACGGPACNGGGNWCGLIYEPARLNNDTFVCDGQPCKDLGRFPWLCGIAAGDVNADGCPDLYLGDYAAGQNRLPDSPLDSGS